MRFDSPPPHQLQLDTPFTNTIYPSVGTHLELVDDDDDLQPTPVSQFTPTPEKPYLSRERREPSSIGTIRH